MLSSPTHLGVHHPGLDERRVGGDGGARPGLQLRDPGLHRPLRRARCQLRPRVLLRPRKFQYLAFSTTGSRQARWASFGMVTDIQNKGSRHPVFGSEYRNSRPSDGSTLRASNICAHQGGRRHDQLPAPGIQRRAPAQLLRQAAAHGANGEDAPLVAPRLPLAQPLDVAVARLRQRGACGQERQWQMVSQQDRHKEAASIIFVSFAHGRRTNRSAQSL